MGLPAQKKGSMPADFIGRYFIYITKVTYLIVTEYPDAPIMMVFMRLHRLSDAPTRQKCTSPASRSGGCLTRQLAHRTTLLPIRMASATRLVMT